MISHRRAPSVFSAVIVGVASLACGSDVVDPTWPVRIQLRLVNATSEMVFIRAEGDESLDPGIARLVAGDSACTTINAYARSVPVEVHSLADPTFVYGEAWIDPLASSGWHGVVDGNGVTVEPGAACSS